MPLSISAEMTHQHTASFPPATAGPGYTNDVGLWTESLAYLEYQYPIYCGQLSVTI